MLQRPHQIARRSGRAGSQRGGRLAQVADRVLPRLQQISGISHPQLPPHSRPARDRPMCTGACRRSRTRPAAPAKTRVRGHGGRRRSAPGDRRQRCVRSAQQRERPGQIDVVIVDRRHVRPIDGWCSAIAQLPATAATARTLDVLRKYGGPGRRHDPVERMAGPLCAGRRRPRPPDRPDPPGSAPTEASRRASAVPKS